MKMISCTMICIFLCIFISIPANAQEQRRIKEGYTNDGVHYTVYDVHTSISSSTSLNTKTTINTMSRQNPATSVYVIRDIYFDGKVTPPTKVYVTECIDGYMYVGTLTLYFVKCQNGKIIATYKGTLLLKE